MKTTLLKFIRYGEVPGGGNRKTFHAGTFLLCLLLAIVFWLLVVLAKNYTGTIELNVKYSGLKNTPAHLPATFSAEINASGLELLTCRMSAGFKNINISLPGNKTGMVASSVFIPEISEQLGRNLKLLRIFPDSVPASPVDFSGKEVPVNGNVSISYAKQYGLKDSITLNPSIITVTGPASSIDKIKAVETEQVVLNGLKETTVKDIRLINPGKEVSLSAEKIQLAVPVEKYTEGVAEVSIEAVNLPAGCHARFFPEKVKIKYLVSLSMYPEISSRSFSAGADLGSVRNNAADKIRVSVNRQPAGVKIIRITPPRAGYLLIR